LPIQGTVQRRSAVQTAATRSFQIHLERALLSRSRLLLPGAGCLCAAGRWRSRLTASTASGRIAPRWPGHAPRCAERRTSSSN